MKSKNQLEITDLKLNVPEEYYPEWYRKGCIPFEVDDERLQEEARRLMEEAHMKIPIQTRQQYPAVSIENEDDIPKIKLAQHMQDPKTTEWFDEMDTSTASKTIDNNDIVFPSQFIPHANEQAESINNIRQKLLSKKKMSENPRLAEPGEYVVLLKNKVQHIGGIEQTKEVCESLIIENEDLNNDDLIVFYRVPLSNII